jgi:hypothetical protein
VRHRAEAGQRLRPPGAAPRPGLKAMKPGPRGREEGGQAPGRRPIALHFVVPKATAVGRSLWAAGARSPAPAGASLPARKHRRARSASAR